MPDPDSSAWVDGEQVATRDARIPIEDPIVHVGLGVFETLALRQGRILDLEPHCTRLEQGAVRQRIPLPGRAVLLETVRRAASAHGPAFGWLKIIVTRAGRWIVVTGKMAPEEEGRAVAAALLPWRRNPAGPLLGVKSTSYAENELGLEEARRRGADEGLWLNTRGRLSEGCTSNLFLVRRRTIFTPARREGILPGVVRELAVVAGRTLGFDVQEGRVRLKRLERADEAFLTSSLCGVRPLVRVDDRTIGRGEPGPVTRAVAEEVVGLRLGQADDGRLGSSEERGDRR